jgi:hypothetical protein
MAPDQGLHYTDLTFTQKETQMKRAIRKLRNFFGIYTAKDAKGMAKWLTTYDELLDMHRQGYNVGWPKESR